MCCHGKCIGAVKHLLTSLKLRYNKSEELSGLRHLTVTELEAHL